MGLARTLLHPCLLLLCETLIQDALPGADPDQATSMASKAAEELRRTAPVGWLEAFPDPWLESRTRFLDTLDRMATSSSASKFL